MERCHLQQKMANIRIRFRDPIKIDQWIGNITILGGRHEIIKQVSNQKLEDYPHSKACIFRQKKTNEKILQLAAKHSNEGHTQNLREIDRVKKNRLTLLGHIVRAEQIDPMREVTFTDTCVTIKSSNKRRVGRPRRKWTETVMVEAWEYEGNNETYDNLNKTQNQMIRERALLRKEPFEKNRTETIRDEQRFKSKRYEMARQETIVACRPTIQGSLQVRAV